MGGFAVGTAKIPAGEESPQNGRMRTVIQSSQVHREQIGPGSLSRLVFEAASAMFCSGSRHRGRARGGMVVPLHDLQVPHCDRVKHRHDDERNHDCKG